MYLLFFLSQTKHFCNTTRIDEIILIGFPTKDQDPTRILFDIITFVMVHGPCSDLDFYAKSIQIGLKTGYKKCYKEFSKPFQSKTVIRNNRYLLYY